MISIERVIFHIFDRVRSLRERCEASVNEGCSGISGVTLKSEALIRPLEGGKHI